LDLLVVIRLSAMVTPSNAAEPVRVSVVPSNVRLASPSSSVVVDPMETNLFSAWLLSAVMVPPPPDAVIVNVSPTWQW
jgi:hypothetical protein